MNSHIRPPTALSATSVLSCSFPPDRDRTPRLPRWTALFGSISLSSFFCQQCFCPPLPVIYFTPARQPALRSPRLCVSLSSGLRHSRPSASIRGSPLFPPAADRPHGPHPGHATTAGTSSSPM